MLNYLNIKTVNFNHTEFAHHYIVLSSTSTICDKLLDKKMKKAKVYKEHVVNTENYINSLLRRLDSTNRTVDC